MRLNDEQLTKVLKNLVQCDFVCKRSLFGRKTLIYKLVDFYTIFYYKFIEQNNELDEQWFCHNMHERNVTSWMGLAFELICLQHHQQIKNALGINGMATSVYTWRCEPNKAKQRKGAQVDMMIERADRMIHLCEVKFCQSTYNIDSDYSDTLRRRMALFNEVTGNTKAVVHTFITTFGLGEGKHNSMVHSEVTMDDLFD